MAYAGVMSEGFRSDLRMLKPGLRLSGARVGSALAQAWIAGSSRSPDRQRSAAGLFGFQPAPGLNVGHRRMRRASNARLRLPQRRDRDATRPQWPEPSRRFGLS